MPNETITLTNMRPDQLVKRLEEATAALLLADNGARLFIEFDGQQKDWPARLSDQGSFEIRAAIVADMERHVREIKAEMVGRGMVAADGPSAAS